jgi:outer membrane lipoprotein-sorting protein
MSRRTSSQGGLSLGSSIGSSLAFSLLLALLASPVHAADAPPPAAELIACMEAGQRDLQTLHAEFTQTSRVKLFKQEMRSEGRLLYERSAPTKPPAKAPSTRLRWEYLSPDPSTMLLIGSEARLRMGDEKSKRPAQVFDMARDANLRAIFAQLRLWLGLSGADSAGSTSGTAELLADYELRTSGSKEAPVLVMLPRPTSVLGKTFARVELSLAGRGCQLTRLLLVEQSGDEKEIRFTSIKRNAPLPRLSGQDPFAL